MKKILFLVSILIFSLMTVQQVSADLHGGSKLKTRTYGWYDSSVSMYGYTPHYDAARDYWNNVSSNVHIYPNYGDYIEYDDKYYVIHAVDDPGYYGSAIGMNITFGVHNEAYKWEEWDYVVVIIHHENMKNHPDYSSNTVKYNAAHEVGHSLKFDHPTYDTSVKSVMWSGLHYFPSSIYNQDAYELIYKWGN